MVVNTCESLSAHALSTLLDTPSGPAVFLGFTALSTRLISCCSTVRGGGVGSGAGGGRSGSCVLDHLKLSKEAVQLLCLWHV